VCRKSWKRKSRTWGLGQSRQPCSGQRRGVASGAFSDILLPQRPELALAKPRVDGHGEERAPAQAELGQDGRHFLGLEGVARGVVRRTTKPGWSSSGTATGPSTSPSTFRVGIVGVPCDGWPGRGRPVSAGLNYCARAHR
jgi:hypothetical protein